MSMVPAESLKANSGILALYMKGVKSPLDEIKGSNPSPCAHYEGVSEYYKADEKKREA
ncbi:MAG: hypothetical protein M3146_08850 [Thermoproteota archaeon]|nr:hypothetical protein [Thermoproteota archaeon]